jgi:hypothetical protein
MAKEEKAGAGDEITMAQVLARLVAIQEGSQEVQKAQLKQTAPKSNTAAPKISVYNPRGQKDYPLPRLKCEIYAPFQITPELQEGSPYLDREEVELFNLLEPGEYQITLVDDSPVPVCVVATKNTLTGVIERMGLVGPKDPDTGQHTPLFTRTNKQTFPPLRKMLREMVGDAAGSVMPMTIERRQIASGELAISVGA